MPFTYYYYYFISSFTLKCFIRDNADHITALILSFETQHFPQHMFCSKQCWHLHIPNDVRRPQCILYSTMFPGKTPEFEKYKRDNFNCYLVYVFQICPARFGISVFVLARPYDVLTQGTTTSIRTCLIFLG